MKLSQLFPLRRACNNFIPHKVQHTTFPTLLPASSHPQTEEVLHTHSHTHTQLKAASLSAFTCPVCFTCPAYVSGL